MNTSRQNEVIINKNPASEFTIISKYTNLYDFRLRDIQISVIILHTRLDHKNFSLHVRDLK